MSEFRRVASRADDARADIKGPAVKRWAGIELKRAVDVDADAAVSMVGKYKQQVLKSV
jgi:hypothetical protein